jgi:8-oxo-dGTP pyrophosphatase MutT (NUDIX family)
MSMIKHATAGAFVFAQSGGAWKLGLIEHPRLGRLMIPGGHVEGDEHCAQAAVREVAEETGLRVRLLSSPGALPLPPGYPHEPVTPPWWVTELEVPADSHVQAGHVHIDHQYVALAEDTDAVTRPAHPFGWFTAAQLSRIEMFEDTRLLAGALFSCAGRLAGEIRADEVAAALLRS